jgi:hypothetical protein
MGIRNRVGLAIHTLRAAKLEVMSHLLNALKVELGRGMSVNPDCGRIRIKFGHRNAIVTYHEILYPLSGCSNVSYHVKWV